MKTEDVYSFNFLACNSALTGDIRVYEDIKKAWTLFNLSRDIVETFTKNNNIQRHSRKGLLLGHRDIT